MKKTDVLQLAIIIMAIIICVNSFQYVISAGIGIVYALGTGGYNITSYSPTIISLLVTLLYTAICWQLIVKSQQIASWLYEKSNVGTAFKIISHPEDLLFILFIITGIYYLVDQLPVFLSAVVSAFKTKASGNFGESNYGPPTNWTTLILRLVLPSVLLMAARPLAAYFAKNVSSEPITLGDDIGTTDNREANY